MKVWFDLHWTVFYLKNKCGFNSLNRKKNIFVLWLLFCDEEQPRLFDAREATLDFLSLGFHVFCLSCHFLLTQTAEKTFAATPKQTASATQTSSSQTELTHAAVLQSPADYGPENNKTKERVPTCPESFMDHREEWDEGGRLG